MVYCNKEVKCLVIRHEDLVGTFEQKKALVAQFNLMDDTFFSVVMEHNDAAEYLLTQLLGKPVRIIENKTQYSIRNAESHSIVLDALVDDEEHNIYDVEVQIGDKNNHERRLRYYRTAIDWSYLEKGKDYSELPELYLIFISDFDPFDLDKVHYEIAQYVKETDREYDSGVHIHYFNTKVEDETFLSELMQYMKNSDPDNNNFGALSRQVNYHKYQNEEVGSMCKAVEDYAKLRKEEGRIEGKEEGIIQGKIEAVKNMLQKNMPFETALELVGIDRQTYDTYEVNDQ